MTPKSYREPTAVELAFLRVVCRGQREIERQLESCRIAEYDPTGWCDVWVVDGPPSSLRYHASGPALKRGEDQHPDLYLDTILWVNHAGMLESVEILDYLDVLTDDPYAVFVEAAERDELVYP
jgi:hypothetical protein